MKHWLFLACLLTAGALSAVRGESYFGVNLSGAEFGGVYPGIDGTHYGYPGERDLDYFKSKGLTLIRFPFRWERIQPVPGGELNATELAKMKRFVSAAEERGMPVILDLHNFARYSFDGGATYQLIGESDRLTKEHLADVWIRLAGEFKDYTNIWGYDMMNEPYSMTAQVPWFDIAQTVIDAIRTVDTATPIIVSGDSFSSALNWVTFSDNLRLLQDPADNLIFQAHLYFDNDCGGTYDQSYDEEGATAQTGVERARPFVEWLARHGKRGIIGEYGIPDNDTRWLATLDNLLQYMRDNGVSGTYWSAGPRWGDYALSVQPTNDYTTDRPQMQVLQKYPSAGEEPYSPPSLPVADFEDGDNGAFVIDGGNCYTTGNPAASGINTSARALRVNSTSYARVAFPLALPDGCELTDYYALRFKVALLPGNTGNLDGVSFDVGVSCDRTSVTPVAPDAGNGSAWDTARELEWLNVELHFDAQRLQAAVDAFTGDDRYIVIMPGRAQLIFAVDDVELMQAEGGSSSTAEAQVIYDFEDFADGASPLFEMPWQGSASVTGNAYPSALNASARCLQVVNPECSPLTIDNALPQGTAWTDYTGVQFDICVTAGDNVDWAGVEIGVRGGDGTHTKFGAAYDHNGNETAAWGTCPRNEWFSVSLLIDPSLVQPAIAHEDKLYIRVMKNNNTYLIDNIALVPANDTGSTGITTAAAHKAVEAWGGNNFAYIRLDAPAAISIYAIDGRPVYSRMCPAGTTRIALPRGLYLLAGNKVIVY